MSRLGLAYPDVSAVHPAVVYLSVSGFGGSGSPYESWPAYAPIVEAMSGIYELRRAGDEPPRVAPAGALGGLGPGQIRNGSSRARVGPDVETSWGATTFKK